MSFLHLKRGNPIAADTNLDPSKVIFEQNFMLATVLTARVLDKDGQVLDKDADIAVNSTVTLVPYLKQPEATVFAVKRGVVDVVPDLGLRDKLSVDWPWRFKAVQQMPLTAKAKKKIKVSELIDQPLMNIYMYID